jgi:hypothetical protein
VTYSHAAYRAAVSEVRETLMYQAVEQLGEAEFTVVGVVDFPQA